MPTLSKLLVPINGSNPSGVDTRCTTIYDRIKEARREELDLPQGVWERERKVADWDALIELCCDALMNHSKDLQIASCFWSTLFPRSEDDELELRAVPLAWIGSQLDFAVKSVPLVASGANWFEAEGQLKKRSAASIEKAARRDYQARVEELAACSTALRNLEEICARLFGEASPRFDGLRNSLQTVAFTLTTWFRRSELELAVATEDSPDAQTLIASATPPMASAPALEMVHFTLSAPAAMRAASNSIVTLWVHLESHRAAVMERAYQQYRAPDAANIMSVSKGPVRIARGVFLRVRLEIPGAHIEDPEDTVLWDGEIGCANFGLTLLANPKQGTLPGRAVIYLDGVQITKIQFVLNVGSQADPISNTKTTRIRKAFASYTSADRDQVLGRLQGIVKAAPYLEIFFDVLTLRSGQRWKEEIQRLIPASDVFYLFWSLNASASEWVEQEWRTALRTGRRDLIDPVPLQTPEEARPPPELASLHFNDWMLAFRRRKILQNVH